MRDEKKIQTTVGELIAALRRFPPETRVLVDGYESGYDDPVAPTLIAAALDDYESSVCGAYVDGADFSAVLIARPGR